MTHKQLASKVAKAVKAAGNLVFTIKAQTGSVYLVVVANEDEIVKIRFADHDQYYAADYCAFKNNSTFDDVINYISGLGKLMTEQEFESNKWVINYI